MQAIRLFRFLSGCTAHDCYLFYNDQGNGFHLFIGCKTLSAIIAKSSSANRIIVIRRTRINHSCIFTAAIRTFHRISPPASNPNPEIYDYFYNTQFSCFLSICKFLSFYPVFHFFFIKLYEYYIGSYPDNFSPWNKNSLSLQKQPRYFPGPGTISARILPHSLSISRSRTLPRQRQSFTLTTSFSHKSEKRTEHSCFSFLEYSMRLSCILCLCTLLHFIIYKLCHFCGTAYKKGRFKFYSFTPPSVSPVTKYFCKNG